MSGRRQVKCEDCREFLDEETGPSKMALRDWKNQREHQHLVKSGELKMVDVACRNCLYDWRIAAGEVDDYASDDSSLSNY